MIGARDGHEVGEATKIIQFGPRPHLQTTTNRSQSVQTDQTYIYERLPPEKGEFLRVFLGSEEDGGILDEKVLRSQLNYQTMMFLVKIVYDAKPVKGYESNLIR